MRQSVITLLMQAIVTLLFRQVFGKVMYGLVITNLPVDKIFDDNKLYWLPEQTTFVRRLIC